MSFGLILFYFLCVCREVEGKKHLLCPPGRWAASPCFPWNPVEQGPCETFALCLPHPAPQVKQSKLITVLIFISSSPLSSTDAVLCLQTQHAGWWETNHKLTFGALRCLGRVVNSRRTLKSLVRIFNSVKSECLREGVNPKRMDAPINDFSTQKLLYAWESCICLSEETIFKP